MTDDSDQHPEQLEEDEIVESFRGYVRSIVESVWNKVEPNGLDREDLEAYGFRGLLEAYRNYDEDRETTFSTYAYQRVKGAMLDGIRRFRRAPRGRRTRERDNVGPRRANRVSRAYRHASEKVTVEGRAAAHPDDAEIQTYLMPPTDMESLDLGVEANQRDRLEADERLDALREAMENLGPEERTIIRLFDLEGYSMEEAAEAIDCSKSWAAKLRARAHEELRERLESRSGRGENEIRPAAA